MAGSSTKDLSDAVKGKWSKSNDFNKYNRILSSSDGFYQFFATIATADDYSLTDIINACNVLNYFNKYNRILSSPDIVNQFFATIAIAGVLMITVLLT
jgi:hypothetical protein